MNNNYQDMFHDAGSRSPASQRYPSQGLHRQNSRQFDPYGQVNSHAFPNTEQDRLEPARFDRMNLGLGSGGFASFENGSQTWNPSAFGPFNTFNLTRTMKPDARGRRNLPTAWMEPPVPAMPSLSQLGGIGQSVLGNNSVMRNDNFHQESDEELIPTAIVIKNIPFAVKKEQLSDLMTEMHLPLPYAFNYHFDGGVFRGLAFANFTTPEETAVVIENLNHFELHGRKLRVEYKKMLPQQERERIEREKRERRGQLEEQHRPVAGPGLQNQQSVSSLASQPPATSPSPVDSRNPPMSASFDLNDEQTRGFYNEIAFFKGDPTRLRLIFPATLTPTQRRLVHTIAHSLHLNHASNGNGEQRAVHVFKETENNGTAPKAQGSAIGFDPSRRTLNRAATTDFGESRTDPSVHYGTLRGQQSTGFLGIPDSPGTFPTQHSNNNNNNLRAAKSYADLRSYTPSPAQSTASFPVGLQSNIARFQDNGLVTGSANTPTLNSSAFSHENLITNGLGNMTIGTSIGTAGSPRRARPGMPWDDPMAPATQPIGANRSFMSNFEDSGSRTSIIPSRQPRGPAVERGPGFTARNRQNGHQQRGSDELRQQTSTNLASVPSE